VVALSATAAVTFALIPLSQSSALDNAAFASGPNSSAVVVPGAQSGEMLDSPVIVQRIVTNAELLENAQAAYANADDAAGLMEQISPNLLRKIAKTSAVIDLLADALDAENGLVAPNVVNRDGLFQPDEVATSVAAVLEQTAAAELPSQYASDDAEIAIVRAALGDQTAQLLDHIATAYEINQGVQAGDEVIEGPRQFSHTGVLLLKQFEGLSLTGYELGDGMCTIGYGIAIPIEEKPDCAEWTITEQEAEDMLAAEVQTYANKVAEHFTRPLTQNQFDALTSFTYNVGVGIYERYGWSPEPEDTRITDAMMLYVNPPQFREGLTVRRNAEVALFNS